MTFGPGAFAGKAPLGAAGDECDTYTSTSCNGVGNKLKLHCVAKKKGDATGLCSPQKGGGKGFKA
ncbi:uncharacterized protein RSE6_11880 [Rhynchosporium secalis]|uniref:Uncharacterized protein n=1 Tax=Rhynchosporium secalis TaxID=38038 RepID=A0A1E1MP44_RHYSE|nr:uncharacterized protein RSE6_11880 [Rhynchosporium secalis]